jgi:phosphatidylserine/phosphatidylglycerophosphate/cardiolipin synthase-like enzyme
MSIDVKVYDNGDHTAIVWLPKDGQPIDGCRGFAVKRNHNGVEDYLHSFVGFTDKDTFPKDAPWKWPVQRYMWFDYFVKPGDTVKYQVIPVLGNAADPVLKADLASTWTDEMKVTGQCTASVSAYFNKGIVAAQWVSRELDQEAAGANKQTALKTVIAKKGDHLRDALGGLLKAEVLNLLKSATGGKLFAALYELNDPELMDGLKALGASANVILANGAFSTQEPDENEKARLELRDAGVQVFDRMVTSGHFAHNKFAVFCDAHGKAQKVLSGSTNWTMTGLCTQANNGLAIDDAAVADCFLQQWNRLKDAGDAFPKDLVAANSEIRQFQVDGMQVTPWFAPTSKQQDMDYARNLIANAKDGMLFLFFNPGTYQEDASKETLLQNVMERHDPKNAHYNANLYIRGVVNQEITHLTGGAPVTLIDGKQAPQKLAKDVLVPANVKKAFHHWEEEALRASMVMVHSKVIVLDPFGAHPVLMTGSHNLGVKASSKNDDNLVILEGPAAAPLAAAYAVNILAIYQTYRWNSYVTQHAADPTVWHGLQDDDKWQAGHLQGDSLAELHFWMSAQLDATESVAAAAGAAHHSTSTHAKAPAAKVKTARTPRKKA